MAERNLVIKWIDALESGKYTHGKEFLCQKSKGIEYHDAYGVLLEVLGYSREIHPDAGVRPIIYRYNTSDSGVRCRNPGVTARFLIGLTFPQYRRIMKLNDEANSYRPVIEYLKDLINYRRVRGYGLLIPQT